MIYKLYQLASFLVYPLVRLLLLKRVAKGKEDPLRYTEKLGFYKIKRPKGKLIWFHAASIGEFNAILPVIKAIAEEFPYLNILVTTVTLTAANIAKNNLPINAIHQFMPLDCINIAQRFIAHWQPNLVIWTESELWPNIITLCKSQAELLLINARLSQRSSQRWNLVPSLAKTILTKFSLITAQSLETKLLLEGLGAEKVIYAGNLKFIAANFSFEAQEVNKLKLQMKNRVVLMAASTHPGEEAMFAKLHHKLRLNHPNLLTIIAPRHPSRINEVLEQLQGLSVVTRSSREEITKDTDIFLADTIGEFGLFFRLTEIVCIGGSWKKIGHSFIEPAKLRNLIIFGPCMDNSRELADEFLERKAALLAESPEKIEEIIEAYFENPENFSHFKDKFISNMILEGFKSFIDIHVKCYDNYDTYKVHFIGSIACLFKKELEQACLFHNVTLGQLIQKPIDGLVYYHLKAQTIKVENNERIN